MKNYILSFLIIFSFLNSQFNYTPNKVANSIQLNGEDYITGEDGVPRMSVNVWGHIKFPGTYLVYDGIDLLSCLSMAGGPLKGAKLNDISIISKDGTKKVIDLNKLINNSNISSIDLKPYDTIYIDETLGNYLLARSQVINILLQVTNMILISINN